MSGGTPRANATIPAPTMFPRIGLPAEDASSFSGATRTFSGTAPATGSARANPCPWRPGRKWGRCAGSRERRMSASARPARTGASMMRTEQEFLPPRMRLM